MRLISGMRLDEDRVRAPLLQASRLRQRG